MAASRDAVVVLTEAVGSTDVTVASCSGQWLRAMKIGRVDRGGGLCRRDGGQLACSGPVCSVTDEAVEVVTAAAVGSADVTVARWLAANLSAGCIVSDMLRHWSAAAAVTEVRHCEPRSGGGADAGGELSPT